MSSATLAMAPTQWGRYEDINDVEPLNEGDQACLTEIREVLKKHGKRERFGVALLHRHFERVVAPTARPSVGMTAREIDLIRPKSSPLDDGLGHLGVDQKEVGREDGQDSRTRLDRQGSGEARGVDPDEGRADLADEPGQVSR